MQVRRASEVLSCKCSGTLLSESVSYRSLHKGLALHGLVNREVTWQKRGANEMVGRNSPGGCIMLPPVVGVWKAWFGAW